MQTKCYIEKDVEDYICKYPQEFLPGLRIIGRQVDVASGRIDILAFVQDKQDRGNQRFNHVAVIELKAGAIKGQDVAQVLRYTNNVWEDLSHYTFEQYESMTNAPINVRDEFFNLAFDDDHNILIPYLVGTKLPRDLEWACKEAGIQFCKYTATENTFRFNHPRGGLTRGRNSVLSPRVANGVVKWLCDEAIYMAELKEEHGRRQQESKGAQ